MQRLHFCAQKGSLSVSTGSKPFLFRMTGTRSLEDVLLPQFLQGGDGDLTLALGEVVGHEQALAAVQSLEGDGHQLVDLTLEGKIRDGKTQICALRAQMMIDKGLID